jgi:hypothetical protein
MVMELRVPEDLTPAILTEVLAEQTPGVRVRALSVEHVHQGSATHLHLRVDYEEGASQGLPERLFFKTQLSSVLDLAPHMATMLSKSSTAWLLANETRFYAEARPLIDVEAPRVFASRLEPDPTQFVIVTEHLRDRHARFPNPLEPLGLDDVEATLETLAKLHAAFWASPRLVDGDLAWLPTPLPGGDVSLARQGGMFLAIRHTLAEPGKAAALKGSGIDAEQLEEAFWKLQEVVSRGPATLLHGDPHLANIYYLPDGTAGLLDWQLTRQGCWVHDVAYAVGSALDPGDRRANERDLLAGYLARLGELGVTPPDWDEAWHLYRCSPPWGFPMWSITPVEMYDEGAVLAVMERFAAAIADLDPLGALGL